MIKRVKVANTSGNASVGIEEQVIPELIPDYFDSYTYSGAPDWIFQFKDEDGNVVFAIDYDSSGAFSCTTYYPDGTFDSVPVRSTGTNDSYISFVYKCNHGVILVVGTLNPTSPTITSDKYVLIARDKNGVVTAAVIQGITLSNNDYVLPVYASNPTDSGAYLHTKWAIPYQEASQTQFVPIGTNAQDGETNYIEKAYITPISQFQQSGWGKFIANGKLYLTNGFIAIEDGDAS